MYSEFFVIFLGMMFLFGLAGVGVGLLAVKVNRFFGGTI